MSLPENWERRMRLPLICAPMFNVTTPKLVRAVRKAGIVAALPRANAPDFETFDRWLSEIMEDTEQSSQVPMAVNLSTRLTASEMKRNLELCRRRGVELIISATGNPSALIQAARDQGLIVFSDAINLHFAKKAIQAGADGIIAIGAGGGGHSGTINHLTLVSAIRRFFDGTIVMAGAVSDGYAVRAAEVLGADMAYMGTQFIATHESGAPEAYKQMLVDSTVNDLLYTPEINGVHANWLKPSLLNNKLNPSTLPKRDPTSYGYGHLPEEVVPWKTLWSAGQGIERIDCIRSVAELIEDITNEYLHACKIDSFISKAGLLPD